MQIAESSTQKNSLLNAMNRFIGAVNNMDQTVMVPSLLRDVPLDHHEALRAETAAGGSAYLPQDADMYSSYVLLKSFRNHIQWGVLQGEGGEDGKGGEEDLEGGEDGKGGEEDLEKVFHFHLKGLHSVLSKLTNKADTLTSRYKEEIGGRK